MKKNEANMLIKCTKKSMENNIICHLTANWKIPETKNSTEIILNENLDIKKFGKECKKYLGDISSSNETFYHFKDIKMQLYNDKTEINADNNNSITLPLSSVISKFLIKIKEIALKDIKNKRSTINESDIIWKLTVPAIWRNKSKQIMINAAQKAGIFDNKDNPAFFFSLEPEAAACNYVLDNNADEEAIMPGNKYIVCDIGGGTVDISTHQRIKNYDKTYIEEVYPPVGGNNGSTYINQLFLQRVISKLFGLQAMDKLSNIINNPYIDEEIYDEYCEFLNSIEKFKIDISEEEKNESKRINCGLFEKLMNEDINKLIKKFNQTCPSGWQLTFNSNYKYKIFLPYQIMIDLTKEVIFNKIVGYLNNILNNVLDIKSIIYAGSVSSNYFIISMIKEKLPKHLKHCVSSYPSTAVVTGAVLFGFDPYIIESRKSRHTIGIECSEDWNDEKFGHKMNKKYFDKEYNCYRCKDCFIPIININEKIKADKPIIKHYEILNKSSIIKFLKPLLVMLFLLIKSFFFLENV